MRTVFFGSGAFAVPILERLRGLPGVELVGVVTTPDRPAGRGREPTPTPVSRRARELDLPTLKPSSLRDPDGAAEVAATRPELAILADFGRIVPPSVLGIPGRGFLNLHPSLLPRHRGATPIAGAILAGDEAVGVTLFSMDEGLDTGPILAQVSWPLAPDATADEVEPEAALHAADLAAAVVPRWLAGELEARPQDAAAATMTRPFRREDGRLDATQSAAVLERRVRALRPWPGTFLETHGGRIVVSRAAAVPSEPDELAGCLVADGDGLAIATADGRLRLLEVRPAGGRTMSGAELRRGRPGLVGQALVGQALVGQARVERELDAAPERPAVRGGQWR
ncbi:MAG TPA: methionyl-tRNA formyltransferase [Candidatus Limnocylindrales bacterium]|nr:methionyl-tRNA formyltransferase [Candidatus Limnocylindrales bacterium]